MCSGRIGLMVLTVLIYVGIIIIVVAWGEKLELNEKTGKTEKTHWESAMKVGLGITVAFVCVLVYQLYQYCKPQPQAPPGNVRVLFDARTAADPTVRPFFQQLNPPAPSYGTLSETYSPPPYTETAIKMDWREPSPPPYVECPECLRTGPGIPLRHAITCEKLKKRN
ncbi:uncharacterized protein LOC129583425 [Paramacrobiotus metropolitanus]|uniref:uncharacterized protein LOC129583425 n=1 Tax=Paramacrobiotus metropolitanus TaxID=2943436 RepID=UPI00244637B4|nr:uncharacterized protein LOC129583425 [Paramacrobiotus metropolitanus]